MSQQVTDSLKTWIAENLMSGCSFEQLEPVLKSLNVSEEDIRKELDAAVNHPYVKAGQKYYEQVKRRESLLKTLDALRRNTHGYKEIKKIPIPAYKDFLRDYYFENKPGHFTGGFTHWAANNWTPRKLVDVVGADTEVEIQLGRDQGKDYETQRFKYHKMIKFGEFIDMVENTESSNNFYLTANNNAFANGNFKNLEKDIGNIGDGYLTDNRTNQMFMWIGPKGTLTPYHHDLTNNFFVQLYGSKVFHLVPSMQVPYMYNSLHVYSDVEYKNPKESQPEFNRASVIEVTVNPGDCLFIPGGWWHHVESTSTNISFTFTNFKDVDNFFLEYPGNNGY